MRKVKKLLSVLLALFVTALSVPLVMGVDVIAGGTCGANLTWSLDSDGHFVVDGSGDMYDYPSSDSVPWYSCRDQIKTASINSGVTSIGSRAFFRCSALYYVSIPESVSIFGDYAFFQCENLISAYIPANTVSIGAYAFYGCKKISDFSLPPSLNTINDWTFGYCTGLSKIVIPEGVTTISNCSFYECGNLCEVTLPSTLSAINYRAFFNCTKLNDIYYESSESSWNSINTHALDDYFEYTFHFNNTLYKTGDIIEFGSYPQTKVTNSSLINTLNAQSITWKYLNTFQKTQDYSLKYCDVNYGGKKYRGLNFSKYRIMMIPTGERVSSDCYDLNTTYWFEYEPIQWVVLSASEGLLMSLKALDAQPYTSSGSPLDRNSYYLDSYMKEFLSSDFLPDAFSNQERNLLQNRKFKVEDDRRLSVGNDSEMLQAVIRCPSYNEVTTMAYGFLSSQSSDDKRVCIFTDYLGHLGGAKSNVDYCSYALRSTATNEREGFYHTNWVVSSTGSIWRDDPELISSDLTCNAVRPICTIDLNAYTEYEDDTTKPMASISSTNNVAASQTVTLSLSDNVEIAGYYWGTSASPSSSSFTTTSSTSATKTVSSAGTYYLIAKDTSGNVSSAASITFYKTTLNANGGSVSPTSILTESGKTFTFPNATRNGYICKGWATSSTATSGNKTLKPTGNSTYYAVWEELYNLSTLTYSFGNSHEGFGYAMDYIIPSDSYYLIYGKNTLSQTLFAQAKAEKEKGNTWRGNCYGMSTTTGMFNSNVPGVEIADFNASATRVYDLNPNDLNSKINNATLTRYIESMQVSQYYNFIQNDYSKNINKTTELCNLIDEAKATGRFPIIALFGPEGGHAVIGYAVERINATESRIKIYDCNYPNTDRYITLITDAAGNYTSWQYQIGEKYDPWGSAREGCKMSYVPYEHYKAVWDYRGDAETLYQKMKQDGIKKDGDILSINSENFEVRDVDGKLICKAENGIFTSYDSRVHELLLADIDLSSSGYRLTVPTSYYEIINKDKKLNNLEVDIVNVDLGATIKTESDSLSVAVDDAFDLNRVTVDTAMGETYEVNLLSSTENGYNTVTLSGTGDGTSVGLSYIQGTLDYSIQNSTGVSLTVDGEEKYTNQPETHTHKYTSTVTKQPTCTTNGVRTYTCTSCSHTYTESITALGHTTPDSNGNCTRCNAHLVDVVDPNACPQCGQVHTGFFGGIVGFFHKLIYRLTHLFE